MFPIEGIENTKALGSETGKGNESPPEESEGR